MAILCLARNINDLKEKLAVLLLVTLVIVNQLQLQT